MEAFKSGSTQYELSMTIGKARRAAKLFDFDLLEGEPAKLSTDLLVRMTLQIDLIWHCLDNKPTEFEGYETAQEWFESEVLDAGAFKDARAALFAEIQNFIQSTRPELSEVFAETIHLMRCQITKSAENAVSLVKSQEVQDEFSLANANAMKSAQKLIGSEFAKLQDQLESTQTE